MLRYTQTELTERMENLAPYIDVAIRRSGSKELATKYPQLYLDAIMEAAGALCRIKTRFTQAGNLLAADVHALADLVGRMVEIEQQCSKES